MLKIGNIKLELPLVLSPMAGISDLPYRLINRSFGCGLAFTEMISASALAFNNPNTSKKLSTSAEDTPLGLQLLAGDPELLKRALDIVSGHGFDLIDFNSACPVKKVASRGKGAGLLRDPLKFERLLKVIIANTDLPVTVKIRSGWDSTSVNAVEMARRAQGTGVSAVFIHGRTRSQRYSGNVDYNIIREVKESIDIPLIASGDALSPTLIKKLFDETGCDGVAVARGGLGNPWIFRETSGLLKNGKIPPGPDVHELVRVMKEHFLANIAFSGERVGIIQFRKFFAWYTRGMSVRKLKVKAFITTTTKEMLSLIDELVTLQKSRNAEKQNISNADHDITIGSI